MVPVTSDAQAELIEISFFKIVHHIHQSNQLRHSTGISALLYLKQLQWFLMKSAWCFTLYLAKKKDDQ